MKILSLLRHAKAEDRHGHQKDYDRRLHKKGIDQTHRLAVMLKEKGESFDAVLCSPSQRTRETLHEIFNSVKINGVVNFSEELYLASEGSLRTLVESLDNASHSALIVAHNPGIQYFFDYLCKGGMLHFSTCTYTQLELDIESWGDMHEHCGRLLMQWHAKEH